MFAVFIFTLLMVNFNRTKTTRISRLMLVSCFFLLFSHYEHIDTVYQIDKEYQFETGVHCHFCQTNADNKDDNQVIFLFTQQSQFVPIVKFICSQLDVEIFLLPWLRAPPY